MRKGSDMKKTALITVVVVIGVMVTGIAAAQFVKPEDAIEYRRARCPTTRTLSRPMPRLWKP